MANNSFQGRFGSNVTRDLRLYYTEIIECGLLSCDAGMSRDVLLDHIDVANRFTNAILPLRDGGVINTNSLVPPVTTSNGTFFAPAIDLLKVWRKGNASGTRPEVTIGVVGDDYFRGTYAPEVTGVTYVSLSSMLVLAGAYDSVPHELGHAVCNLGEEYKDGVFDPSFGYPQGFFSHWKVDPDLADKIGALIRSDQPWVEDPGRRPTRMLANIMGPGAKGPISTWIRKDTYHEFFKKLSASFVDPTVVLVSGYIDASGKVVMMPSDIVSEGDLTPSAGGPYSLRFLDSNGASIFQTNFSASSEMRISPVGSVQTNYAPFGLVVPYLEGARDLVIDRAGVTIHRQNLGSKTLRDAIESIPERAFRFKAKATIERRLLLKTVGLIERSYSKSKNDRDTVALLKVLRGEVQLFVSNEFVSADPTEYNKAKVISLVDRQIASLR